MSSSFEQLQQKWRQKTFETIENSFLYKSDFDAKNDHSQFAEFILSRARFLFEKKELRLLELGCGDHPVSPYLFDSLKNYQNTFVDIHFLDYSPSALDRLRQAKNLKNCSFHLYDFCKDNFFYLCPDFFGAFDLVIDSHFLHTCTQIGELRPLYWQNVSSLMCSGSLFFAEHMISSKQILKAEGHRYEGLTQDLWLESSDFEGVDLPVRHIPRFESLEKELHSLKKCDLKIKALIYHPELEVSPVGPKFYISSGVPNISRFILEKGL